MIGDTLKKLRQVIDKSDRLRLDGADLDILETLFAKEKQKQYDIEKRLKESGKSIAHSTMTGKIKRLSNSGFVNAEKEEDGHTYYKLSAIGVGFLLQAGKISFSRASTYFMENQMQYLEFLARLHPNLIEQLEKQPPWFPTQLTPDLWAIYTIRERSELQKNSIRYFLAVSKGGKPEQHYMDFSMQLLCSNRVEIEGNGICMKEKEGCPYKPGEAAKCLIIRNQMLEELQKLERH